MIRALLFLALAGCANEMALDGEGTRDSSDLDGFDGAEDAAADGFRVDVHPPSTAVDADGERLLLSQSYLGQLGARVDLVLSPAVEVTGVVSGYVVTPYAMSDLPGAASPLVGRVSFQKPGTVQGRNTTSAEDGVFATRVVADDGYRIAVVPDDPQVPFTVFDAWFEEDTQLDVTLDEGAAVWGRVLDGAGGVLPGVPVRALADDGTAGAWTTTGPDGHYTLRVAPGGYRLESPGRDNGRDPRLTSERFEVPASGAERDLRYASLEFVATGGRVIGGAGGLEGITVRFTSVDLDGYDDDRASLEVRVATNGSGTFDTRLLEGVYRVDVMPGAERPWSPTRLGEIDIREGFDLGEIVLSPTRPVVGQVFDPEERPVQGALVRGEEIGFEGRSWTATTDIEGAFLLDLPDTPIRYSLTAPATRTDLAMTTLESASDSVLLGFLAGERVEGSVHWDDGGRIEPLPYAVVEIRDALGVLRGIALTDERGDFALPVAWMP